MTFKNTFFSFLLFSMLTVSAQAWAVTVSYDQKVSVDNNPVATLNVLVQDDKMRAESDFNGVKSILYRNEKGTFTYMPAQKLAAQMPPMLDRPNITRDIPRYQEFLTQNNGVKAGAETVNGVECDIYTFTEPNINRPGKVWMWREKSFPVKIEVEAPEGKTTIEILNINFSPAVSEADFQVPDGVKIFDPMEAAPQLPTPEKAPALSKPESPALSANAEEAKER